MRYLVVLMIMLLTAMSQASPFLTCDPYVKDGEEPIEFVIDLNGTIYTSAAITDNKTTPVTVTMMFDLKGKTKADNVVKALARNRWAESVYSVPLSFKATGPSVPGGLRLSVR